MSSDPSDEIAASLMRQAGRGASAAQVAESVAATCREIEDALTPIVGTRGVAALVHRSVHVAAQTHAWLSDSEPGLPQTVDLRALTARPAHQSAADAAAGGALLLHTFHTLLASLIGASLTGRLLRSAWAPFLSSTPMDTSP
jgi:hypothetical protein